MESRSPRGATADRQKSRPDRRMSLRTHSGAPPNPWRVASSSASGPQSTVSILHVPARRQYRSLQTGRPRSATHGGDCVDDLFVVPTIAFQQLFAFLVLGHERRRLLWFAVTRNPTASAGAPDHRSVSLGQCTEISYSRQRRVFGVAFKVAVCEQSGILGSGPRRTARPWGKMG